MVRPPESLGDEVSASESPSLRRRLHHVNIPDLTENWGWSQTALWLLVGAVLGVTVAADRYGFEYDFSHFIERFKMTECTEALENC